MYIWRTEKARPWEGSRLYEDRIYMYMYIYVYSYMYEYIYIHLRVQIHVCITCRTEKTRQSEGSCLNEERIYMYMYTYIYILTSTNTCIYDVQDWKGSAVGRQPPQWRADPENEWGSRVESAEGIVDWRAETPRSWTSCHGTGVCVCIGDG